MDNTVEIFRDLGAPRILFDLDLFLQLNKKYKEQTLMPHQPRYDIRPPGQSLLRRVKAITRKTALSGKWLSEIGCERGETSVAMAKQRKCKEVIGVAISHYPECSNAPDLSTDSPRDIRTFDVIYSNFVWEYLKRPYKIIGKAESLIREDRRLLLSANLFRSPLASHRYREVYFPSPTYFHT